MENLKKTPLFETYKKHNGKIIDFAGWAMPVQFEGIIEEHNAVRNAAGLFDVSHMGEVEATGEQASDFVQNIVTNDISVMEDNQVLYTMMCYENGGVVDDLLVYRFSGNHYFLVVNASNAQKDYKWMADNKGKYEVNIVNISQNVAQLALQGPNAQKILQKLTDTDLSEIKFFFSRRDILVSGMGCLISRTGYTGEDGFEIYMKPELVTKMWDEIMKAGEEYGIKPAGLGCRDTLRFEANLALYGNEISQDISPLEAGFGFCVKLNKDHFIGKDALTKQKAEGLKRKISGFEMKDRGIPRHGYEVYADGEKIGFVTTGYFSPTLKKNIGLALIDAKYAKLGNSIEVMVRNKLLKAEIVSRKFYNKNYKK